MGRKKLWQRFVALWFLFAMPVIAMAANSHDLSETKWRPIEIAGNPVLGGTKAHIQFRTDGTISAHGGCNQMGAGYTADKTGLRVGPIRATRRGCQPAIMAVETAFAGALEGTRLYLRNGDKLTLKNAQGVTTMRLVASR